MDYASSAGTFIALSCDQIDMNSTSALGMIDPQFRAGDKYYSAKEVLCAEKSQKDTFSDNLIREAAKNIENTCKSETEYFLKKNYDDETIKTIMNVFYNSKNSHSKHLFYDDVHSILGDRVKLIGG